MFKRGFFIFAIILTALLSSLSFAVPKAGASTPIYNYDLTYQSAYPSNLAPGATTNVWVEIKNTGNQVWKNTGNNIVRLGSGSSFGNINQNRDYASEFANSDWLSKNRPSGISNSEVRPGETTRFQFNIKAPTNAGVYKAYFTPVVDGYTWMKDIGIYWQITVGSDNNISKVTPTQNDQTNPNLSQNLRTDPTTNSLVSEFAPSVVKIMCKTSAKYWNQGSGTLYHNSNNNPNLPEYYIMTNLHIVKTDDGSPSKCDIKIVPDYKNKNNYFIFESNGYKSYGNVDFAILEPKINSKRANAGSMETLALYAQEDNEITLNSAKEGVGEKALVIGYPENGDLAVSEGNITGSEFFQGTKYIDTSATLRHGNSGGLAINSYGQILGIPSFLKSNGIGMILDIDYLLSRN